MTHEHCPKYAELTFFFDKRILEYERITLGFTKTNHLKIALARTSLRFNSYSLVPLN